MDGANGEPLSVGRRTRSIPPALRRTLSNRDHGCRLPGRPATHRLHGHHVQHWANGGDTSLDNLVLLCPTHHRLVHDCEFDDQRLDDGRFRFINPHGLSVRPPRRSDPSSPEIVIRQNDELGIAVDCETAHWYGERIDYDHTLMVTMPAWDSGDTVPEAGPAAGDLNPSKVKLGTTLRVTPANPHRHWGCSQADFISPEASPRTPYVTGMAG